MLTQHIYSFIIEEECCDTCIRKQVTIVICFTQICPNVSFQLLVGSRKRGLRFSHDHLCEMLEDMYKLFVKMENHNLSLNRPIAIVHYLSIQSAHNLDTISHLARINNDLGRERKKLDNLWGFLIRSFQLSWKSNFISKEKNNVAFSWQQITFKITTERKVVLRKKMYFPK